MYNNNIKNNTKNMPNFVKNKIQSYWVKYKYWEAAALQLREEQLGGATTTGEPKTL